MWGLLGKAGVVVYVVDINVYLIMFLLIFLAAANTVEEVTEAIDSTTSVATSNQLTAADLTFIQEFITLDTSAWAPADVCVKNDLATIYEEIKEECEAVLPIVAITPIFGGSRGTSKSRYRHYLCSEPNCGRVFLRSDSFSRHKAEHARGKVRNNKRAVTVTGKGICGILWVYLIVYIHMPQNPTKLLNWALVIPCTSQVNKGVSPFRRDKRI